jgi:hypothetical protein
MNVYISIMKFLESEAKVFIRVKIQYCLTVILEIVN